MVCAFGAPVGRYSSGSALGCASVRPASSRSYISVATRIASPVPSAAVRQRGHRKPTTARPSSSTLHKLRLASVSSRKSRRQRSHRAVPVTCSEDKRLGSIVGRRGRDVFKISIVHAPLVPVLRRGPRLPCGSTPNERPTQRLTASWTVGSRSGPDAATGRSPFGERVVGELRLVASAVVVLPDGGRQTWIGGDRRAEHPPVHSQRQRLIHADPNPADLAAERIISHPPRPLHGGEAWGASTSLSAALCRIVAA